MIIGSKSAIKIDRNIARYLDRKIDLAILIARALSILRSMLRSSILDLAISTRRVGRTWLYQISDFMSLMLEREVISNYDRLYTPSTPHIKH